MKDNIITFILIIIICLIIACIAILGVNIYNNYVTSNEPISVEEWLGNTIESEKNEISIQDETLPSGGTETGGLDDIQYFNNTDNQETQKPNYELKDNYFYNQLENEAKVIYLGLNNNKDKLKTGTYKIEYGDVFTEILSSENGQKILGDYYQSAIEAFLYDNPDVFYINANKMFLNVESTTYINRKKYNVFIDSGNNPNYLADGFSSKQQIEQCEKLIDSVTNQILSNAKGTTYEKIRKIHDLLVTNLNYDSSVSKDNIYNIYGALVNRECVCEGYAKSFKYLLNKAGINCVIVIGQATNSQGQSENHSWNYVEVEANWYAVDVTWDDPVIIGNGIVPPNTKDKYFLKGYNSISKDHIANGQFTEGGKEFKYPSLNTRDY